MSEEPRMVLWLNDRPSERVGGVNHGYIYRDPVHVAAVTCEWPGTNRPPLRVSFLPDGGMTQQSLPQNEAQEVVGSGHDEQTEGRIRELETALRPFADAYEHGVAGDYIWPANQSFYRQAYHALRGTRFKSSSVSGGE